MSNHTNTDPHTDLQNRMVPSPQQVHDVEQMFEVFGFDIEYVITPIAFPGKEYGCWTVGQEVLTPNGQFLVRAADKHGREIGDEDYRLARDRAAKVAEKALGGQPGTYGYVIHRVYSGEIVWSVFEDILSSRP